MDSLSETHAAALQALRQRGTHPLGEDRVGATREGIVLEKAYWRASVDTDRIYPCSLDRACKGGDGGGEAEYCNKGYFGPFCATCESGWFM